MNPVTHFLIGWELGCALKLARRDRALVVMASIAPDLDGLGVVGDLSGWHLGPATESAYRAFHHFLLHGLLGAAVVAALAIAFGSDKKRALLWSLCAFHLHLLCDLLGSRGPAPSDQWPIYYLGPFSRDHMLVWSGQWALNAWPNIVLSVALLASTLHRAATTGLSPTQLLGARVDAAFVRTLKAWAHALT